MSYYESRECPDRYYSQVIDDVFKSIEDHIVERVWAMTQEKIEDLFRSKIMTPGSQNASVGNPPSPGPNANDRIPEGLILADERNFCSFSPDEEKLTKIVEFQGPVGAFDIYGVGPIFWSEEESTKTISVHTSNLQNATLNSVVTIFEDVRTNPKAMAMDNLSGNLYVIDDLYVGKLFVLNIHTRNFPLLITDLNIQEIVVDSNHGLIFMLQNSNIVSTIQLYSCSKMNSDENIHSDLGPRVIPTQITSWISKNVVD
ncbi:hypothetical protein QAD02_005240 [Eretmocerus hayati]|uniref:Uncharacterized protein n=1 Tax=Eretmocerus hayati TaxID=131215 RepID=A0ACC2NSZ2_9HYME|nr:hypothetical protein QAD02_005240 [Eretmocerus hayati]